ncbi:DNA methyltransferase [Gilliamella sp. App6-5]|nr:DNA methyltransferase [Gilliamella apicola]
MHSLNKVDENIKKIGAQFPNCITERKNQQGEVEYAIDFDLLKQELSSVIVEGREERYQFTWPDKKKSILLANAPIAKTLRPCREESVDFDDTENLYIEGDNLEVLKLLQETYLGKVKMIYIDPPYNTGNDFVYEDDFAQNTSEYLENSGQFDDEGNRLIKNMETNGRFHTDWLNMIYPRLKLARDLLTDDGVIFISIDDNEIDNLKKICDEVFGTSNFISNIIWKRKRGRDNSARWFSKAHEYCLLYAKNKNLFVINFLKLDEETKKAYKNPDNDPRGSYRMLGCWARGTQGGVSYDFTSKNGQYFQKRLWLFSKENLIKLDQDNKLVFKGNNIYRKMFINENKGKIPETLWDDVSNAANASDEIKKIFDDIIFDTPKPTPYIKRMIDIAVSKADIVLDFFSGSSTTAHAVMQLNAEDGGNRKFIMVQLPESTDEKSEAYKAGYKNICEIGKERIRRAGNKIAQENPQAKFDKGFRVLKCDSSNMKEVYYNPAEYNTDLLDALIDNIKADRTPEDLLFQVMLDLGVLLSSDIKQTSIAGKTVFNVADNFLMACFDTDINEEVITAIAKQKPYYFVMRDSSLENDSVATNFEQIFTTYSPETKRKVL